MCCAGENKMESQEYIICNGGFFVFFAEAIYSGTCEKRYDTDSPLWVL